MRYLIILSTLLSIQISAEESLPVPDLLRGQSFEKKIHSAESILLVEVQRAELLKPKNFAMQSSICAYEYHTQVLEQYKGENISEQQMSDFHFSTGVPLRVGEKILIFPQKKVPSPEYPDNDVSPGSGVISYRKDYNECLKQTNSKNHFLIMQNDLTSVTEWQGKKIVFLPLMKFWVSEKPLVSRSTTVNGDKNFEAVAFDNPSINGKFFLLDDVLTRLGATSK